MSDEETWPITLASKTYELKALPLKATKVVYTICQRLSNDGLAARLTNTAPDAPALAVTDEEFDGLCKIALTAAQTADPELTQAAFDAMPITPPELYDAFFEIRKACGGWRPVKAGEAVGEPKGTDEPPT